MLELLWLIPVLPFAGFLALTLIGGRISRRGVAIIGVGTIGLSTAVAIGLAIGFIHSPRPGYAYSQILWTWMRYRW